MNHTMVSFNGVSKRYRLRHALRNVSFDLPQGRIIGLIGANGSGKSTCLNLMAGLIHPTTGRVLIQGKPAERRISRDVTYMSDADSLYAFYTVAAIMEFYQNVFPDFNLEKARDMLSFMNLEHQTIIMSTHEVAEIEPLLDTVVLLHEGGVVDIKDVDEIRTESGQILVDWMTERLLQPH